MTDEQPYSGHFAGKTHRYAVRVYFEDTDLGGVVYHANYLRFMERARSDMLRSAGIDQRAAFVAGEGVYAIRDMTIRYHRPATLDDALRVDSRLLALRGATCTIAQMIWRGDTLLVEAEVLAAFITPDGRARRQPAAWRDMLQQYVIGDCANGH